MNCPSNSVVHAIIRHLYADRLWGVFCFNATKSYHDAFNYFEAFFNAEQPNSKEASPAPMLLEVFMRHTAAQVNAFCDYALSFDLAFNSLIRGLNETSEYDYNLGSESRKELIDLILFLFDTYFINTFS